MHWVMGARALTDEYFIVLCGGLSFPPQALDELYSAPSDKYCIVFCAGLPFSSPQALDELYSALDRCEGILARQRYLVGNALTEADIRLFVSLIRFDEVSSAVATHKC